MNQSEHTPLSFLFRFEKKGPLRFISHLDLTRLFHRAFLRGGIPLKYSEGFSPHPKFSLALPLSVGTESECEWACVTLKEQSGFTAESLQKALSEQMPAGLSILRVVPAEAKLSQIAFASYQITLPRTDPLLSPAIQAFFQGPVVIKRKNKKGKWVEKELSEGIHSLSCNEKNTGLEIDCCLAASGESYLKPEALLQALTESETIPDPEEKRILRKEVFLSDLTPFPGNE